jgi:hypothetical protein
MSQSEGGGKLPKTFKQFVQRFPELGAAHERIGMAVDAFAPRGGVD